MGLPTILLEGIVDRVLCNIRIGVGIDEGEFHIPTIDGICVTTPVGAFDPRKTARDWTVNGSRSGAIFRSSRYFKDGITLTAVVDKLYCFSRHLINS